MTLGLSFRVKLMRDASLMRTRTGNRPIFSKIKGKTIADSNVQRNNVISHLNLILISAYSLRVVHEELYHQ